MLAVREGQGRVIVDIPRPQIGWQSWFTATGPHMAPVLTEVARWCPSCAGRGQVIAVEGRSWRWETCPSCLGVDWGPR